MLIKTLINGKAEEKISAQDRGLHYGDGVFETLAISQNKLLCFDEHYARLRKGCERLAISTPEYQLLLKEITTIINTVDKAVLKIIITRGQGGRGYAVTGASDPNRIISLYQWPESASDNSITGIKARLCQYRYQSNSALAGIKHLNRIEQILARSEWQDEDIAEGIVLDENDDVIEGTMSNLFMVKDNELHTPDLSKCGVEGIVRQKIIELAREIEIKFNVKNIPRNELITADEVFVCNSIIGVWPVNSIDDQVFKSGHVAEKVKKLLMQKNIIC